MIDSSLNHEINQRIAVKIDGSEDARMATHWKTLSEREAETRLLFAGQVAQLEMQLANYGSMHRGAFHLFGSAANGTIHDASDVDILVDFPQDRVFAACEFAGKACFEHGLQPDVRPMIWVSNALRDRALAKGRSCP